MNLPFILARAAAGAVAVALAVIGLMALDGYRVARRRRDPVPEYRKAGLL